MECIMPVKDPHIKEELEQILSVFENDNCSAWDMQPDSRYVLRHHGKRTECRAAQKVFIDLSSAHPEKHVSAPKRGRRRPSAGRARKPQLTAAGRSRNLDRQRDYKNALRRKPTTRS
jgi:polyphosphate kinase